MAQRSPNNPRYQKDAKIGKTRRSAASAKPKRELGEAGGSGGKGSSAKSKPKVPFEPDTPEFKRWRKIWLGLLIAAVVFSLGSFALPESSSVSKSLALVFAYSTLFTALWVDLTKIRRMRKEWQAEHGIEVGRKKKKDDGDSKKKKDDGGSKKKKDDGDAENTKGDAE